MLFVNVNGTVEKGCYIAIEASTAAELDNVHYKKAGSLNGNVIYYNLNGTMSNGIAYVSGKAQHRISYLPESEVMALKSGDGSRMVQGCTMVYIETGYYYCVFTSYSESCGWQGTGYSGFPVCDNGGGSHVEHDVEQGFEGGGGGGSASSSSNTISNTEMANATVVADGKPKIQDIKKYTDCFNDGKQAQSYRMTIYADQPIPGQNDQYKIIVPTGGVNTNIYGVPTGIVFQTVSGRNFNNGHTFVTFAKNNIDGTSVRQTLGFYPKEGSGGSNPKGSIKDNSESNFDVSYTITVTEGQFNAGLNRMKDDFNNGEYHLFLYNCTNAAIAWMNAAGAGLVGAPRGLFNNTPGDFGQALRQKATANKNGGNGVIGKGPCN